MDYQEAVEYLDSHISLGVQPGLSRINDLLEVMGSPQDGYPIIHVAGSNGKTSTSLMATWLLVAHGLTTGTYTSPHLEKVEERLAINGRYSSEEEFALAVSDVAAFAGIREESGADPNTYFELTTAAAFTFFADQAVNAAVLEVGLGGRLDATNVVEAEVCVVTSIGKEHTEYLGEDIGSIAGEKLAIAGPSSILITGQLPPAALTVAEERARELGIHHRQFGRDYSIGDATRGVGGWLVSIEGAEETYDDIFLPLRGSYQLVNLATAIAASEALVGRKLDLEAVHDAVASASIPGRMEPVAKDPLVVLDGAHNADGMATLVDSLAEEFPGHKWHVVLGVMGDKDVETIAEHLGPLASGFIATAPESERAVDPKALARRVAEATGVPVLAQEDAQLAVDMARAEAGPEGSVLVTGSLYLVGEVRASIQS
jgi:dihydrofolate synthase/folylpolyglutamate synthase